MSPEADRVTRLAVTGALQFSHASPMALTSCKVPFGITAKLPLQTLPSPSHSLTTGRFAQVEQNDSSASLKFTLLIDGLQLIP